MKKQFFNCYLIGEDQLLLECADVILTQKHLILGIISPLPEAEQFAFEKKIPFFKNFKDAESVLLGSVFDYLFSIVNSVIVPEKLLKQAINGAINYHNAPLPKYAGLHGISWAILNNESTYGVTWHFMVKRIDAGDILKQACIELDSDETALSLGIKCYQKALSTFEDLIHDLSFQKVVPIVQNLSNRTYYSYYQKPRHGAWISWNDSAEAIDRMCRALSLGNHYNNRLAMVKFRIKNDFFLIQQARMIRVKSAAAPGTILKITKNFWQIATLTYIIQLERVIPLRQQLVVNMKDLAKLYSLKEADLMSTERKIDLLEYQFFEEIHALRELFWIREIKNYKSALLPFQHLIPKVSELKSFRQIERYNTKKLFKSSPNLLSYEPELFTILTFFLYLNRTGNKESFGVGLSHPRMRNLSEKISALYSSIIPFIINVKDSESVQHHLHLIKTQWDLCIDHLNYCADLPYRYPDLKLQGNVFYHITIFVGKQAELKQQIDTFNSSVVIALLEDYEIHWYNRDDNELLDFAIQNSVRHFPILLREMLNDLDQPVSHLPILSPDELQQITMSWNETKTDFPNNDTIISLFNEQVHLNPDKVALTFEGISLSYASLHKKSDQVASILHKKGVVPGQQILICSDKKIEFIVGLVAILKLGAVYVPIDVSCPSIHIQFILSDCNAVLALVSKTFHHKLQACCLHQHVDLYILEELIRVNTTPYFESVTIESKSIACIIYTSGTTGKPKGVLISHQNIIRLIKNTNYINITSQDCIAQSASIGFDAAIFEIWGALLNGARVAALAKSTILNISQFEQYLINEGVSILFLTPALFNQYAAINPAIFRNLSYLLLGGDVANPEWITRVLECPQGAPTHILNCYGPTENTTFTTTYLIRKNRLPYQSIPIGKPIANTSVYVLDANLQLVPVGAPGELYTGGYGVAQGYLNRPEVTQARFVLNTFSEQGGLLYKTGDIVRWLPDGVIDYLGRTDNHVKIRGFRVELEAVYNVLLHYPAVSQCTLQVVDDKKHQKSLVAYVVLNDESQPIDIHQYLTEQLPQYMIPSYFIRVDRLPLTVNGKVNFEQLPAPNFASHMFSGDYIAPHTEIEKKIEDIWCVLFGLNQIGIYNSFFDLGGHSLMITQLVLKIKEHLNYDVHLQQFLENPTISHLAYLVEKNNSQNSNKSGFWKHWHADAEVQIHPFQSQQQVLKTPNAVLVTGANGFLGINLVYQLYVHTSATIYCLLRSSSEELVQHRWNESISKYFPQLAGSERIKLLSGDLEKPYLGLSIEQFLILADQLDIIYHNGAKVHHLFNYEVLRAANVFSVKELINLATIKRFIPIHYVSTLSAAGNYTDQSNTIIEDFIFAHPNSPPQDGYSQTKLVAEQILAKAYQQYAPIKIYRPGWILGHSISGKIPAAKSHLLRLIKGCLQLGFAPDWEINLDIMPVDYVSEMIIKTSLNETIPCNIFNLINPNKLAWKDVIAYLTRRGHSIKMCSSEKWINILRKKVNSDNALYSLLTLYINQNENDWMTSLKKISKANNQNTIFAFNENNMQFPLLNKQLLNNYFSYLEQIGFLNTN